MIQRTESNCESENSLALRGDEANTHIRRAACRGTSNLRAALRQHFLGGKERWGIPEPEFIIGKGQVGSAKLGDQP